VELLLKLDRGVLGRGRRGLQRGNYTCYSPASSLAAFNSPRVVTKAHKLAL